MPENTNPLDGGIPPEIQRAVEAEMERRQRMHEAITHFYTGDYVALNTKDIETLQVSWKGANELTPMILLCKSVRTELAVEVGDVVKVEYNGKSLPCLVERQFKTLKSGATVNRIVAHVLGLTASVPSTGDPETANDGIVGSTVKVSSLL